MDKLSEKLADVSAVPTPPVEKLKSLRFAYWKQKLKWIGSDLFVIVIIFLVSLLFFFSFFSVDRIYFKSASVSLVYFIAFEELKLHKMWSS